MMGCRLGDCWFERWREWLSCHPRTMLYLVVATTVNLVLQAVEVFLR
jgi:hypothetical protein